MSWSLCLPRWPHGASLVCFCFVPVFLSLSRHSAWEEPSASPSFVCTAVLNYSAEESLIFKAGKQNGSSLDH